jgi:hypothetical protein
MEFFLIKSILFWIKHEDGSTYGVAAEDPAIWHVLN